MEKKNSDIYRITTRDRAKALLKEKLEVIKEKAQTMSLEEKVFLLDESIKFGKIKVCEFLIDEGVLPKNPFCCNEAVRERNSIKMFEMLEKKQVPLPTDMGSLMFFAAFGEHHENFDFFFSRCTTERAHELTLKNIFNKIFTDSIVKIRNLKDKSSTAVGGVLQENLAPFENIIEACMSKVSKDTYQKLKMSVFPAELLNIIDYYYLKNNLQENSKNKNLTY